MKYDNFSLPEFMQESINSYISDIEMELYIRHMTSDLDSTLVKVLFLDVNKISGGIIKFSVCEKSTKKKEKTTPSNHTSLDVYISERYIYLLTKKNNTEKYDISDDFQKFKDAFYYLSAIEKIKLLTTLNTEEEIEYDTIIKKYEGLLRFCYLVEQKCRVLHKTIELTTTDKIIEEVTKNHTQKVTTDIMLSILKQTGVSEATHDKTKIAKLISSITGFSNHTIRQRLTNPDDLTKKSHGQEIDNINRLFKELNMSNHIKYDNT